MAGELAGYRLLVTSVRTGDTEIFCVDPDLGDAINLTRSPTSEDRYPCWSGDGKQIAFISDRAGGANLFVMNADGTHVRQITRTTAACYMPSWVGERIVFGMHGREPEMASIKPDGSDLRMLGAGHDPCLSPDGTKIAYTGDVPGGTSVFVMNADGSDKRRIVHEANPWGAIFPSWSPHGNRIVYSFKAGNALELFIVRPDGSGPRQLTRLGKVCTPAAWSPDGKWISFRCTDERYWSNPEHMKQVYGHPLGDKRPVWVIRPDGSDAHLIEALHYQCAMDGSRAAWKPDAVPLADGQWQILFDGTSVNAFRGYKTRDFPKESWSIEGDTLKANPDHPLDLITREQYGDFDLELEWKVEKAANSGVMYHVSEDFPETYMTGPEMQVVDDDNTDDGKEPKTSAGSLYALIAPKDKKCNPFGQWNKARLRVSGPHVEYWMNGTKIVEYELGSPELNDLIAASKFKAWPRFAKNTTGYLALQNHGGVTWYRNIRIRKLPLPKDPREPSLAPGAAQQ